MSIYKHGCLTYFFVEHDGNLDKKEFCKILNLDENIIEYFSTDNTIEIGRNELYDVDVNKMVRVTLKDLLGKEEKLLYLKEKYNLYYALERVPSLVADTNEPHPILGLDNDIIEFLVKTKTVDDLDYYVLP